MRLFFYYPICIALMFGFYWLVKLAVTGISPHFGYGLVSGAFVTLLLARAAEKLGYKEPRY